MRPLHQLQFNLPLPRRTSLELVLAEHSRYPDSPAEPGLVGSGGIRPPLLLLATNLPSVMRLAFRRQLGFVFLHAFRHASFAWLNVLAQAIHVFHARMMTLRFGDFRATAAGKFVIVLGQAAHDAPLPCLHPLAKSLGICLARFCEFLDFLTGLGNPLPAPRRQFRLVLFQTGRYTPASRLNALAQLLHIRPTCTGPFLFFRLRCGHY